jgi:hypothetical protein
MFYTAIYFGMGWSRKSFQAEENGEWDALKLKIPLAPN